MAEQTIPLFRGIDAFISAFAGTVDPSVQLTVRHDPADMTGFAVWANDVKFAVLNLASETQDTSEKLLARLPELRRPS
jgi:hypothetical protein